MNTAEFLLWEMRSRDTIDVKRCYIDISGDLVSGVLLSQVIYWHLPDENGNTKLRVHHDGHDWLAKKREDWWGECRITPKQFDRAIEILETRDLVITHIYRFNGSPTKHIRMNWDGFFKSLESLQSGDIPQRSKSNSPPNSIFPKGQNPTSANGNLDFDKAGRSITKTPAKNTPEITHTPPTPPAGGGVCEKEAEAVAVKVEVVTETEEEIQNKIRSSVESEKQAIQLSNLNPGEDQGAANENDYHYLDHPVVKQEAMFYGGKEPWFSSPGINGWNSEFVEYYRQYLSLTPRYSRELKQPADSGAAKRALARLRKEPGRTELWSHWEDYQEALARKNQVNQTEKLAKTPYDSIHDEEEQERNRRERQRRWEQRNSTN